MLRAVECGMRLESDFWCLRGPFWVPFGYLAAPFRRPNGSQDRPNNVPRASRAPERLQRPLKWSQGGPQVAPKRSQEAPRRPQEAAKRPPGGPQEAPRGPLMPQMVPERVPRAPKMPPRGLQTSKNAIIVSLPELATKSWLLLTHPFKHSRLL